jgi:flagellin-like hook-associated protein FlgL
MRFVGWLAAILGVVGLVIWLTIAVGVWFVRPTVVERVDHVARVAVEALEQASDLSTDASELLVEVGSRLEAVATTASSVSGNPILTAAADRLLSGTISNVVVGPWTQLQDRLSGMRETAVGLSTTVRALDEAIPFIELPGVVTGFVDDVDARWTEVDQTVQGMGAVATEGVGTAERAQNLARTATEASAKLDALNVALGAVHEEVETAQSQIEGASDQIEGILGLSTLAICIIAIWVGVLHLLLIAQGRRWIRGEG